MTAESNPTQSLQNLPRHPLLKWPGGKRWIAPSLVEILRPQLDGAYFEPFLGAGAIYTALKPKKATLSDINAELIQFYRTLRSEPEAVLAALRRYKNNKDGYYAARGSMPRSDASKAARFLFLNRTCWGGIYRLNRNGEFNVPYGDSGRRVCSKAEIIGSSQIFRGAELRVCDFAEPMMKGKEGDVIYADPPYTTKGQNNGFVRYNEKLFAWSDQVRLATQSKEAAKRGAFVCVSGLWHDDLFALYPKWWAIKMQRKSLVSRNLDARIEVNEVLLFSRKPSITADKNLVLERVDG